MQSLIQICLYQPLSLTTLMLHRAKFKLSEEQISTVIEHVKENGIDSSRFPYDGEMPDEDDRVFFHHSHLYSKAVPSRTTWRGL